MFPNTQGSTSHIREALPLDDSLDLEDDRVRTAYVFHRHLQRLSGRPHRRYGRFLRFAAQKHAQGASRAMYSGVNICCDNGVKHLKTATLLRQRRKNT